MMQNSTHHIPMRALLAGGLACCLALGGLCGCRAAKDDPGMQRIALILPQTDGPLVLYVRSAGFSDGEEIPSLYAAEGKGVSPALAWSGIPETARSIAVMVEDPDAPKPNPYVHWLVYNISPYATGLPENVPNQPVIPQPGGAMQGVNSTGAIGYFGPKPPKDDPPHHYHFQVFALDKILDLKPGASRQELIGAMNGHVVAKGQVVGTYQVRD